MTQLSDRVRPGDLIQSDLMNLILQRLQELSDSISGLSDTGRVSVPSVFARTLADARTILALPMNRLNVGNVIDAFGLAVDVNAVESRTRLVVNQIPPPGARVASGSAVDLVLAAKQGTGGTTPSTLPTIDPSVARLKTPIGEEVIITGSNFAQLRSDNQVFFDNVPAPVPSAQSGTTALFVRVPDVTNPPTGTQEKQVPLRVVITPTGQAATSTTILLAKLAVSIPTVSSIDIAPNDTGVLGELVTIHGTGFAAAAADNVVLFGTQRATAETTGSNTTTLVVRVPRDIPEVVRSSSINVIVTFREGPQRSPAFPLTVARPVI